MKLNTRTIQVLKNFASINPSIQFSEGSNLKTISPNKTMMAKAKLEDIIPSTFAIYDLSRFLGVVSLFEDPEYQIEERMVNIASPGRTVSYTFADPSTIITPPDREIVLEEPDVVFELKQEHFADIMKALGVMSFPDLVVVGEEGKVFLRATDTKNPSSDKYDIEVGSTDRTFTAVFKTENVKILPSSYTVSLSSKGISHFVSDDVEYWISLEANSIFE
jgi:hypothetical protein